MGARQPLVTDAEVAVAAALVRGQIHFEYEPKEFRLHLLKQIEPEDGDPNEESWVRVQRGFRPDFFLPEHGLYIEAGTLTHKRKKTQLMRLFYPNVKTVIFDNSWINALGKVRDEDVFDWFLETWIAQEYGDIQSVRDRVAAREEHMQAKIAGTFGPSMRSR